MDENNILGKKEEDLLEKARTLLKMPIYYPKEHGNKVKLGSGVEVVIDKRKPIIVLIDGALVLKEDLLPEQELIPLNSPLGNALMNRGKNESGNFKINGKIHTFKIYNVFHYEKTKHLFFPKFKLN
jgi:transcription elongation GreA/GreB family factor